MSKRSDQGGWPASGVGLRLRLLRDEAGLSQTELAARAGCTQSTLAKLEAGKQEPAWPLVIALAAALEVTPNDLLPQPGDRQPPPAKVGWPKGRPRGTLPATGPPEPAKPLRGRQPDRRRRGR